MSNMPNKILRERFAALGRKVSFAKASGIFLLATFALCGLGASAQITLSNSGPLTLKSGTFGTFTVTATPITSYTGGFLIACSGLPQYAYCIYPGQSQAMSTSGTTASTVTLVVNTSQVNLYQAKATEKTHSAARIALGALFAPSALLLLVFRKGRRKGFGGLQAVLALVLMVSLGGISGCGSTNPQNTPVGSYTFTVGALQYAASTPFAKTTVSLIVN